jgi:hypothetical protein
MVFKGWSTCIQPEGTVTPDVCLHVPKKDLKYTTEEHSLQFQAPSFLPYPPIQVQCTTFIDRQHCGTKVLLIST